jgi:hypothetical protein
MFEIMRFLTECGRECHDENMQGTLPKAVNSVAHFGSNLSIHDSRESQKVYLEKAEPRDLIYVPIVVKNGIPIPFFKASTINGSDPSINAIDTDFIWAKPDNWTTF